MSKKEKKFYRVVWDERRHIDIKANSMNEAEEKIKQGDFMDRDVESDEVTVEVECIGEVCGICNCLQDEDGRCKCTNEDSN